MIHKIRSALALTSVVSACGTMDGSGTQELAANAVLIQYLEIVTPEVDATCALLERVHGVSFGDPVPAFGNARTAPLNGGGQIGVRAPMRDDESPVVRPYLRVDDIEGAVEAARAAGTQVAIPPMEMPGHGKFSIYLQGGIDHGLWKL